MYGYTHYTATMSGTWTAIVHTQYVFRFTIFHKLIRLINFGRYILFNCEQEVEQNKNKSKFVSIWQLNKLNLTLTLNIATRVTKLNFDKKISI